MHFSHRETRAAVFSRKSEIGRNFLPVVLQQFQLSMKGHSMALFDFIREAGEKLFHTAGASATSSTQQTRQSSAPGSSQPSSDGAADAAAGDAILAYIKAQKLDATALTVTYESSTSTATVYGVAPDQATREKIILCAGNVSNVSHVDDRMSVEQGGPEAKFYAVKSGDTLSKIAKESYGDANQYTKIFEANRPMLKDPDKIYPGQMLRIP
jgi:nucleoid-associated protein YgaU